MHEYFEHYAAFFKLRPYIRFHHRTLSVTPLPGNQWRVEVASGDGSVNEEVFDAVFVCTGHHSNPNTPEWEGVKAFENNGGRLIHSHNYRDPAQFIGKKVAVVGIGNSGLSRIPSFPSAPNADRVLGIYIGVDISSELSTVVTEMHLITRSGAWIWPRFIFGHPYESYLGNHHPSIAKQYTMHKKAYPHNLGRFCMTVMPAFISLFLVQMMLVIANGSIPPALKPKHNIMGAHPTGLAPSCSCIAPCVVR